MSDLIKALQIFLKYDNPIWPTHCEHDQLRIVGINPSDVSDADKEALEALGFHIAEDYGEEFFVSPRFGSA